MGRDIEGSWAKACEILGVDGGGLAETRRYFTAMDRLCRVCRNRTPINSEFQEERCGSCGSSDLTDISEMDKTRCPECLEGTLRREDFGVT